MINKSLALKSLQAWDGSDGSITLLLRETYAQALYNDPEATEDDLLEAVAMLEKLLPEHKRIFGPLHPRTVEMQKDVDRAKIMLRLFRARAARTASRSVQDAADK